MEKILKELCNCPTEEIKILTSEERRLRLIYVWDSGFTICLAFQFQREHIPWILISCVFFFTYFKIVFDVLFSCLVHWLFSSMFFNLHILYLCFFQVSFCSWFPVSCHCRWKRYLIWFQSSWISCHILWSNMGSILENIPCVLEKNMYSAVWDGMFYQGLLSWSHLMSRIRLLFPY